MFIEGPWTIPGNLVRGEMAFKCWEYLNDTGLGGALGRTLSLGLGLDLDLDRIDQPA